MKDVILNEMEKESDLQNFIKKRIEENKKLFTIEELHLINKNYNLIKKIYILAAKDSRETFENKTKKNKFNNIFYN